MVTQVEPSLASSGSGSITTLVSLEKDHNFHTYPGPTLNNLLQSVRFAIERLLVDRLPFCQNYLSNVQVLAKIVSQLPSCTKI